MKKYLMLIICSVGLVCCLVTYSKLSKQDINIDNPLKKSEDALYVKEVPYNESNLVILINKDSYIPLEDNMLVYIDKMICLNSDNLVDGKEQISSNLNFEYGTSHVLEVSINDEIKSSLIFKVGDEKQWLIVEYGCDNIQIGILDEMPMFD